MGDPPLIVAALAFARLATDVDPLTGAVGADRGERGPSRADLAALEHALRIAGAWGGRVLAVSVAPREADGMLRDALAAGADEVLRVDPPHAADGPGGLVGGAREAAAALAGALPAAPALVLCGDRSAERGTGSFPAFLAAELGAAQALGAVRIEAGRDGALRVDRRLDGGRREVLRVTGPAVVSVEAAGVRLRRAALPALLAARGAEVPTAVARETEGAQRVRVLAARPYRPRPREMAVPSGPALRRVLDLTGSLVERTPPTVVGPLEPGPAVDALLEFLRRHGYVSDEGGAE